MLILGGTTEARELAGRLASRADVATVLSLAGRTEKPVAHPVPVRTGGFGGAAGLSAWLRDNRVDLLIDATHPFAARISANAEAAAALSDVPLVVLRRPGWAREPGDDWIEAGSISEAVESLGAAPRRTFAALGRQELAPLQRAPQHFWLVRSVDPVIPPLDAPRAEYLLGRGPFAEADEIALLRRHRIDAVLCKNSGGAASYGKIAAARRLGLPVFIVARPPEGAAPTVVSVEKALALADHRLAPEKRGE